MFVQFMISYASYLKYVLNKINDIKETNYMITRSYLKIIFVLMSKITVILISRIFFILNFL